MRFNEPPSNTPGNFPGNSGSPKTDHELMAIVQPEGLSCPTPLVLAKEENRVGCLLYTSSGAQYPAGLSLLGLFQFVGCFAEIQRCTSQFIHLLDILAVLVLLAHDDAQVAD